MRGRQPCKATCSFFKCGQRALFIKTNNPQFKGGYRSGPNEQRTFREGTPYCNWVGDTCVVSNCNYAFCEKRALLPDGSCGLEERENARLTRSIEEEAVREEKTLQVVRDRLLRKTGMDFLE